MSLIEKIYAIYPVLALDSTPFTDGTIRLRNDLDERGDYIESWKHPTLPRPTDEQLMQAEEYIPPSATNWTKFRSDLNSSPEWVAIKTRNIYTASVSAELTSLMWQIGSHPELAAEAAEYILAIKAGANPTSDEKTAIAKIMRENYLPEQLIQAVEV